MGTVTGSTPHTKSAVDAVMQPDRFTKSSHDNTLFDAWFCTVLALVFASIFLISDRGTWLLRSSSLLLAIGFWLRYWTTKRQPLIWEIVVDHDSLRYLRDDTLVDEVQRNRVTAVRCYTPWSSMEGLQVIKLDLRNGQAHQVLTSRLNPEFQNELVSSIERQWGVTATNSKCPS